MKSTPLFCAVALSVLRTSVVANAAGWSWKGRSCDGAAKRLDAAKIVKPPDLNETTWEKLQTGQRLDHLECSAVDNFERKHYLAMRARGVDEVSNTREAAALRAYRLRFKKRRLLFHKREASFAEILFPGETPEEYVPMEHFFIFADLVESRKAPIAYNYYDLPMCPAGPYPDDFRSFGRERQNLGSRLLGHDPKVAPFQEVRVKRNIGCTPLCTIAMNSTDVQWMRRLIGRQYRVQLSLDQLPVLMRSKEYNYAIRGYPIGFRAPLSLRALLSGEFYLFNHLKFVITYNEDPASFEGVRIIGFDVHPMSFQHEMATHESTIVNEHTPLPTCNGGRNIVNDPETYFPLRLQNGTLSVTYSYEVEWVASELPWADRWDVFLIGAPDDDVHYFSITNSLIFVLFLTGVVSAIMGRTLRKDIGANDEMNSKMDNQLDTSEDTSADTGWKAVHGDVFRPPSNLPMILSVLVGTGCQIGAAFTLAVVAAMLKLSNPMKNGHTLTALIILYVLCGGVAGYVSSRLYKFMDGKAWKANVVATAVGLPGCLLLVFTVLNIFLSSAGAATAVGFQTIISLFLLWVCVSAPLVFVGAFFGRKADKIECPVKTNQISRVIPPLPYYAKPLFTFIVGGLLPFGTVCIELLFIMSILWLRAIYYYVVGFLFAALLILTVTCAQVSMALTYLQLSVESHRWWWSSFWNCASAGLYFLAYAVWFLNSRLEFDGAFHVGIYLTYMGMMSICFGMYCGAVGFLASFWFTRRIYRECQDNRTLTL